MLFTYVFFIVLFFAVLNSVCLHVICQDIPSSRHGQTSALVGNKLYFFGGYMPSGVFTDEVWYLNLSSSLNTETLLWYRDTRMLVVYFSGASCVSTIDKFSVFLVGGETYNSNSMTYNFSAPVYEFNSKASNWTTPIIIGFNSSFINRNTMQGVINNNSKIFIFGGYNSTNPNSKTVIYNDMNILDITTMNWLTLTQSDDIPSCIAYTATLLSDGRIIYIGGIKYGPLSAQNSAPSPPSPVRPGNTTFLTRDIQAPAPININNEGNIIAPIISGLSYIDMNKILIFDTTTYAWSNKTIIGDSLIGRIGHSIVLTQNGNIILYGGSIVNLTTSDTTSILSELAVLNTISWTWSILNVSKTNAPPPLTYHSATLYENYMIISFGQTSSLPFEDSNKIYILNTLTYTWVIMSNFTSNLTTPTNQTQTSLTSIVGISVGIGLLILIGVFSFIIFLLRKRRLPKPIPTPGSISK
ncbi:galactose oxidase [Gigaspora margarita]|uniref:Galactose oxidase n=1 Tax=Gigaspora margarita TaxID=4874 RepID=A0A8H4A0B5_GIGMA|nr:galactose oxidase [Gigaspora margarita]